MAKAKCYSGKVVCFLKANVIAVIVLIVCLAIYIPITATESADRSSFLSTVQSISLVAGLISILVLLFRGWTAYGQSDDQD